MNINDQLAKEHEKAVALWQALRGVNECRIPVVCRDRSISRKQQAKLARELFKSLGLKGLRVVTPRGANLNHVAVILPQHRHEPSIPGVPHHKLSACDGCKFRTYAHNKLDEILARAFPQHDNRSDYQSDYFDFCWSVY